MEDPEGQAAVNTEGFRLSVVRSDEEFRDLRREWTELIEADDSATIFQTWEFQYHTWKIFEDSISPRLVLVRDPAGALVGIAPFGDLTSRLGPFSVRVLQFASERYCDYCGVICRGDRTREVLAAVASWLGANSRAWDVIRLDSLLEGSALLDEELFLSKIELDYRVEARSVAPRLVFDPSWTTYEDALPTKRAKSMRYMVGKLFRRFDGEFVEAAAGTASEQAVQRLMDFHQARMAEKHERGHFGETRVRDAMQRLVEDLGAAGLSKLHTIASPDRTIAALWTFEFRGSLSFFHIGFAPDYGSLSPGQVILALRIDEAIKDPSLEEHDFLDGDEPYKSVWANDRRRLYTLTVSTGSWRAAPYRLAVQLRGKLSDSEWARRAYLWYLKKTSKAPEEPTDEVQ